MRFLVSGKLLYHIENIEDYHALQESIIKYCTVRTINNFVTLSVLCSLFSPSWLTLLLSWFSFSLSWFSFSLSWYVMLSWISFSLSVYHDCLSVYHDCLSVYHDCLSVYNDCLSVYNDCLSVYHDSLPLTHHYPCSLYLSHSVSVMILFLPSHFVSIGFILSLSFIFVTLSTVCRVYQIVPKWMKRYDGTS